jgi:hypothetical protein
MAGPPAGNRHWHCGRRRASLALRLGERSGASSLQQLAPDQLFLSFDTGGWFNGCLLQATVSNGNEGGSEPYLIGRIVRVPKIERFEIAAGDAADGKVNASVVGQNLETIEKSGWSSDQGDAITDLPLPVAGEGHRQILQIKLPAPPDSPTQLYVWLRGESKPRCARVRP